MQTAVIALIRNALFALWLSQNINKPVQIIECQYSKVDLDQLLGIKAFNLDKLLEKDPEFLVGVHDSARGDCCHGVIEGLFMHGRCMG